MVPRMACFFCAPKGPKGLSQLGKYEMVEAQSDKRVRLIWIGVLVECGLMLLGLLFGWLGFYDHQQPISSIDWSTWPFAIRWGLIMLVPMLAYLVLFHFWTPDFYRPMQRVIDSQLRPMFAKSNYLELLILATFAGFGEELFFRWCLQGGITSLLEPTVGTTISIGAGIAIASLIFGVCHWVNKTYAITTTIVGAYLGATMVWTGTWLVPAIAHAAFDFVALIYIVNSQPQVTMDD